MFCMGKRQFLSGVYPFSTISLEPKGHDSTLRDQNQFFLENLGKYIHNGRVIQETTGCYRFTTWSYNSTNDQ